MAWWFPTSASAISHWISELVLRECKRYDCTTRRRSLSFELGPQGRLEIVWVDFHFTRRDLFVCCALKAEFADCQAVTLGFALALSCVSMLCGMLGGAILSRTCFRADRRAEDATGQRAVLVEIAKTSRLIERWTRLVVAEVFESFLCALGLGENAGFRVAGKIGRAAFPRFESAMTNARGTSRIVVGELVDAFTQTRGVQLVDGEDADTALRATGTTYKEVSAVLGRVGQ
jgi:hypothetical protein